MGYLLCLWASLLSAEPAGDSHARMLAELARIEAESSRTNDYFGDASIQRLTKSLAELRPDAPVLDRVRVEYLLGNHLLLHGETDRAITLLESAHARAPGISGPARNEIRLTLAMAVASAHLRKAENENCIHCRTGESCLFPIVGAGIHLRKEGAQDAIRFFADILNEQPGHLTARWLYNIAHMANGTYPEQVRPDWRFDPRIFESDEPFPRFRNVAKGTGLDILNHSGGAIADDFDLDGDLDIVTSNWSPRGQLRFFRNEGTGTFADSTREAGLEGLWGGLNLVQTDFDNDGNLDILVLRGAWLGAGGRQPNSLLRNDGSGTFRDITFDAGLANVLHPTHSAAWGDHDLDGDLDLYAAHEQLAPGVYVPSSLYRNEGGQFTDAAESAGVLNRRFAKGAVWGDFDNDRWPDLYVSNLLGANRLYHNQRDGTFVDIALERGVALPRDGFGTWFWDYNNDGWLDLFAASYSTDVGDVAAAYLKLPISAEPDRLYEGDGKGGFNDVSLERGLPAITMPMGANFGDLDNDGFLDYYLGTGATSLQSLMPNILMRNHAGRRFANVTTAGGFGHLQKGHGIAFADLDNDGDQDVFSQLGGAYRADAFTNALYENPGFGNHWLAVDLIGVRSNRAAIGAKLHVIVVDVDGGRRSIHRWVQSGGSFGANPLRVHLGLGKAAKIDRLEIWWPASDRRQVFASLELDHTIQIREGSETVWTRNLELFQFADLDAE